jgi:hypothetical protein
MKKILQLTVFFTILMTFAACSSKEPVQTPVANPPVTDTQPSGAGNAKINLAALCAEKNGNWLEEYSECEGGGDADWCRTYGGNFNECASACRHNPEAEICTMQCVLVCSFAEAGPKPADVPNTK